MTQLIFDLQYAIRNLRRGGLWTVFAVICIGAGVSSLVALRSLGLAIGDTLTESTRDTLGGDISIARGDDNPLTALINIPGLARADETAVFSQENIQDLTAYIDELNGQYTLFHEAAGVQIAAVDAVTVGRPQFMGAFLIDPASYDSIDPVNVLEPPDTPLADLLPPGENAIVVSENFAQSQKVEIGDTVQISGGEARYTVRGIIASSEEAGLADLISAFFGFAYIHQADAAALGLDPTPNRINASFPPDTDIIRAAGRLDRIAPSNTSVRNYISLRENLAEVSDVLDRLMSVAGLGALIIGGLGIINTMLVMVRRRTLEIATLKTMGLRGGAIARLFFTEALLLGLMGSLFGIVLGVALSGLANGFGEVLLQQDIAFRFYPQSTLYGLGLGMAVTAVFGVLPILTATKVRPAEVMRPNEVHVPVVGVLQGIGVLILVIVTIGVMVGAILAGFQNDNLIWAMLVGLIGTTVGFAILGVLLLIMWVIVWIVSRLPAFGNTDLQLALRNMTSRRWRTATTLVLLVGGMYALSSITFAAQSARDILGFQLSNTLGGNVLIFPFASVFINPDLADPIINRRLDTLEGIESRTRSDVYLIEALALDGVEIDAEVIEIEDGNGNNNDFQGDFSTAIFPILARRTNNPNLVSGTIIEGRDLTPEDEGKPYIVLRQDAILEGAVEVHAGQTLLVQTRGSERPRQLELEVIGVVNATFNTVPAFTTIGTLPGRPQGTITTAQVNDESLNAALLGLSSLPTAFILDLTFIDNFIQRIVAQLSALPNAVGVLSLFAVAAIMANGVLLATLERRKQIGVLRAIGLKSRRVLGILLLENSIIALLGAGIGIGLSALNSALFSYIGIGEIIAIPFGSIPTVIALVGAALAIAWASTFASANVVQGESVTTVLRYD
ncbi:MAG: ABC transporter permease [Phototrophicaceae bacterium]